MSSVFDPKKLTPHERQSLFHTMIWDICILKCPVSFVGAFIRIAGSVDINELHPQAGLTAMHMAAKHNNVPLMEELWALGADVDVAVDQNIKPFGAAITPLHVAVQRSHIAATKFLCDNGADQHTPPFGINIVEWRHSLDTLIASTLVDLTEYVCGINPAEPEQPAFSQEEDCVPYIGDVVLTFLAICQ